MKTFTATEAKNQLALVMETAQHEPITIEKNGRPYVMMISALHYNQSLEDKEQVKQRLFETARRIGAEAQRNGMTEEILQAILDERD